jgi:UDP-N-acetylmuramoylalanine--D-glutamate ligase
MVALESFPARSAVFIVGGYDKHVSFDALGAALARRAGAVVTIGATAGKIARATAACGVEAPPPVEQARDLPEAVRIARRHARRGQAVVLSPACASYDMFVNYEQRGEQFVRIVAQQPA